MAFIVAGNILMEYCIDFCYILSILTVAMITFILTRAKLSNPDAPFSAAFFSATRMYVVALGALKGITTVPLVSAVDLTHMVPPCLAQPVDVMLSFFTDILSKLMLWGLQALGGVPNADLSRTKEQLQETREDIARLKAKHDEEIIEIKREHKVAEVENAAQIKCKLELKHTAEINHLFKQGEHQVVQLNRKLETLRKDHETKKAQIVRSWKRWIQEAETRHTKRMEAEQRKEHELNVQLWARKAKYLDDVAKARRLLLDKAKLKQQLETVKSEHANEVAAIKIKCEKKVLDMDHTRNSVKLNVARQSYAAGAWEMKNHVLQLYPGVVDDSRLTPVALPPSLMLGSCLQRDGQASTAHQ